VSARPRRCRGVIRSKSRRGTTASFAANLLSSGSPLPSTQRRQRGRAGFHPRFIAQLPVSRSRAKLDVRAAALDGLRHARRPAAASRTPEGVSESVICGANLTESPVFTPSGRCSRSSNDHATLPLLSRTTSSSNSSHPRTYSSTAPGRSAPLPPGRPPVELVRPSRLSLAAGPAGVKLGPVTAGARTGPPSSSRLVDDARARNRRAPPFAHGTHGKSSRPPPFYDVEWCTDELDASSSRTPSIASSRARLSAVGRPSSAAVHPAVPLVGTFRHSFDIEAARIRAVPRTPGRSMIVAGFDSRRCAKPSSRRTSSACQPA